MNRVSVQDFETVSERLGMPVSEVARAAHSFFDAVVSQARRLPFDNVRKIYSKEAFDEYSVAQNIPSIGRIGTVYSRYLKWRRNESKNVEQEQRRNYRSGITQDDIENMAGEILSGKTPSPVRKKKTTELYHRVWLVGQDRKKLARQVIPKNNTDVQD